jgi:dCTP deaminase
MSWPSNNASHVNGCKRPMTNSASPTTTETLPNTGLIGRVLPSQDIRQLVSKGSIHGVEAIIEEQIQPASLDLRLSSKAYRIRASFLPGRSANVEEKIAEFAMHEIDLRNGAVLEKGCVYLVQLMESLDLDNSITALANPKSSIGRLDVFTRLITDRSGEFDRVQAGYRGPLFAEVAPLTFSIVVRKGDRLSQLRLKHGSPTLAEPGLADMHTKLAQQLPSGEQPVRGAIPVTVDTRGQGKSALIGYKAKKYAPLIDIRLIDHYDPQDYWEPIHASRGFGLVLIPDDFYILASKEPVVVPPDHAAEMVAYDTLVGEFRVHYAGFLDPGFGDPSGGGAGSKVVLEVRSHEVPFMLEDGQIVGRLIYEKLATLPDKLYGGNIGSSYQSQGLQLSKQFRRQR